jgi:hypothetical protein
VILDTKGNVFGGVTPVKWESSIVGKDKADYSLKSFLFTMKNPHNIPAKRFALKAEKKDEAIYCGSTCGPCFGGFNDGRSIAVEDNCNREVKNHTRFFGNAYINDTRLDAKIVFTGSETFKVEEIEVFEITA